MYIYIYIYIYVHTHRYDLSLSLLYIYIHTHTYVYMSRPRRHCNCAPVREPSDGDRASHRCERLSCAFDIYIYIYTCIYTHLYLYLLMVTAPLIVASSSAVRSLVRLRSVLLSHVSSCREASELSCTGKGMWQQGTDTFCKQLLCLDTAVSSHNYNLQNFNLGVSNPRTIEYSHFKMPF